MHVLLLVGARRVVHGGAQCSRPLKASLAHLHPFPGLRPLSGAACTCSPFITTATELPAVGF